MITSVFSKSRPINYVIVIILLVVSFLFYQFNISTSDLTAIQIGQKLVLLVLLVGSLLITNFITKKNGLSKDNSYTFLLFFIFLILFPDTLSDLKLILSNAFILLALRRLISMHSMITPKEKIFDASLWVFLASLINFWCILFLLLVFSSIILHVSRDYRNWLIPFIAFFTVLVIGLMFSLAFYPEFLTLYPQQIYVDFTVKDLTNVFQNIAVAIYVVASLIAFVSMLFILQSKMSHLISSYRKVIFAFIIGLAIYFVMPEKHNSYLIYTFVPVAIMLTNYLEKIKKIWLKEGIVLLLALASLVTYLLQIL
ncbi:hypothetical protein B0A78_00765 [Flavobacterium columnare NBRC 100251 = ATCC 23463]|uniref:Beta-carotene 15,15'-monooxygenase n=2 Tax=Flavobacterium columnare TaxID=996 RepID=G8X8K7_FLACA|nr:DUF6427 family protein [Flavobacterium columnare]AEW86458.1 hypothetical protein FCOL_08215 [Flavobacterium columnare ATCC 49512]AMO20380.1 hypothetical protein UN65_08545 [Flavobacterium columnare]ANO49640.1 hypothetical protein Pf1_01399 [Flavobacterium columnare]APT22423.1 hypothetical protein BU993_07180 [Flavobacterium columnare]AUX18341.1 hypothetical protein AQ623_08690 [Flavobacterium columnare]